MSMNEDRTQPPPGEQPTSSGRRGVPPINSTGGDLVDQAREGFDRLREGVTLRFRGRRPSQPPSRAPGPVGRRPTLRSQAVPRGSEQSAAGPRGSAGRRSGAAGRADRNTYTLVFAAVLLAAVVGLFLALSWALGSGGPFGSGSPPASKPNEAAGPLASPAPLSTAPAASPSPSPSPSPELAASPVTGRVHVVEGGDTLNRIAQRYGVTVDAVMQANKFTDRNRILRIGERLVIPDGPGGSPIPR